MKKLIFSILPAFLFAFISCMNMSSGSGENGSVRVVLPGSGRATYSYDKNNAGKFIVRLYNDDDFDQTEEGAVGGVIEFGDLEPGKYTATAEAWNLGENILEGSGSTEITVRAGETTDCNIAMILEGQTAYYSKYMILTDYPNIKYIYDYPSCNKSSKSVSFGTSYNTVEDNNGQIYHIKDSYLYKDDEQVLSVTTSNLIKNPLYYDSTTNTYWIGLDKKIIQPQFWLQNSSQSSNTGFTADARASQGESFLNFAVQGNKVYLIYIDYEDSSDPNIIYFTKDENVKLTEQNRIQISSIDGVSGKVTDMAVLEDGTVAVLVNEKSLNPANQFTLNDGCTVYSRGALVLLSSDLSTYEVYGWKDSSRTISATGKDTQTGTLTEWTSIEAYIPEYEERNSYFYGPLKIVAIRPKEIVIADCGANFVLPDYDGKKNGKMYAHNRLMTVDLRNFAISCKKEFSESELKFKNLMVNGGGTDSYTIKARSSYNAYEGEK